MQPAIELKPSSAFLLRERAGVVWLESASPNGVMRFPLAFDEEGGVLDLGLPEGADDETVDRVSATRRRVADAIGIDPSSVGILRQVHGEQVVSSEAVEGCFLPAVEPPERADGLIAGDDGSTVAVTVADCAPIAITGTHSRVLLHCGWRGLATGMLETVLASFVADEAVIGPCIGPCCYQVGPEVAEALGTVRTAGGTIDLVGEAKSRLLAAGVASVGESGLCTACHPEAFFSHRRQGASAGRHVAFLSPE